MFKKTIIALLCALPMTASATQLETWYWGTESYPLNDNLEFAPFIYDFHFKQAGLWAVGEFSEISTMVLWSYGLHRNSNQAASALRATIGYPSNEAEYNLCHPASYRCTKGGDSISPAWNYSEDTSWNIEDKMSFRNNFYVYYAKRPDGLWPNPAHYEVNQIGLLTGGELPSADCETISPGGSKVWYFENIPAGENVSLMFDFANVVDYVIDPTSQVKHILDPSPDGKFDVEKKIIGQFGGECVDNPDGTKNCSIAMDTDDVEWLDSLASGDNLGSRVFWKARFYNTKWPHPIDTNAGDSLGCLIFQWPT